MVDVINDDGTCRPEPASAAGVLIRAEQENGYVFKVGVQEHGLYIRSPNTIVRKAIVTMCRVVSLVPVAWACERNNGAKV